MKRSKTSLSHYHLTSGDMGQLLPVGCMEVLPGDTFEQQTSALIRVTPQVKPVMHPVSVNIAHYYVPNRILWSGWEDFITGVSATAPPTISGGAYSEGTLADYLGVYDDTSNDFSALPIRAYNKIWNENFRDQDIQSEVSEDTDTIQNVNWQKDYFTTARPWAVAGDAVTLGSGKAYVQMQGGGGVTPSVYSTGESDDRLLDAGAAQVDLSASSGSAENQKLYADLTSTSAFDVNEFREAFAKQRYQEARARYGSNYVDYLRFLGINPRDQRLQRPEFLGAGRTVINFSEVLQTAEGTTTPVGEMTGHGIAAMKSNRYRRFFPEHGWVLSLMYVRPKGIYMHGVHRKFFRTTKEDFFQKELQFIGQQEVYNKEIQADHSTPDGTFGYQDRYSEYLSEPSRVSAEFRNSTSYDWHFGRAWSGDQSLNTSFLSCTPTKRPFAEQTEDSLWIMAHHKIRARRPVGKNLTPKVM